MNPKLFVAYRARDEVQRRWGVIGVLSYVDSCYQFQYTQGAKILKGFEPFPAMPDWNAVYRSETLFPVFSNRMLSPRRPEYEHFLRWCDFDSHELPDTLALLGVTEGYRVTDAIELFPAPIPDLAGCYQVTFFLRGLRHMPAASRDCVASMQEGDALELIFEDHNPHDPLAVALQRMGVEQQHIGYVPRYLAREIHAFHRTGQFGNVHVTVKRINLDAPLQFRLLCQIQAPWPNSFTPCSDPEYQPLSEPAALAAG